MSSRFILIEALIFESRSTTCDSSRSLFFASNFSVAITCATELFRSGIRSRMSRIVCWSMSSGSSVLSTIPPKSERIERFILVHSPIFYSSSSEFRFEDHGSELQGHQARVRFRLYDTEARTVASYSRFRREYSKEQ